MSDYLKPNEAAAIHPQSLDIAVGRNRRGEWLAVEAHGHCGGIFVSREDALRYAAAQSARPASEVRLLPGLVELRI